MSPQVENALRLAQANAKHFPIPLESLVIFPEEECTAKLKSLVPVLDQFISAAQGHPDIEFWKSFYKIGGGSGGPFVNGAINVFFPYLRNYRTGNVDQINDAALNWEEPKGWGGGPSPDSIPSGLARVPFKWFYHCEIFPMELIAGFVGANQNPETGLMRPAIGWAVADRPDQAVAPQEEELL
jgi:hypothetical protein